MISRGEPAPEYCHPDHRDKTKTKHIADIVKRYVTECLPGVHPEYSIVEPYIYTVRI